jgi:predicted Rossmann fold flavoprotein
LRRRAAARRRSAATPRVRGGRGQREAACEGAHLEGQARALQQKRSADSIMDVISSDAVGKFPDGNAAEALRRVPGISVETVVVTAPGTKLKTDGPVLITHAGLSGPGILKLSAWGAREFAEKNYAFPISLNWVPPHTRDSLIKALSVVREQNARKQVTTFSPVAMPQRLWERFVIAAGIPTTTPWAHVSNPALQTLATQLTAAEFKVDGKSMFKDEFVTCGGVKLSEVEFKTMESRKTPGLHFAGEVLDIDGVTGGFNFQNAWTTGYLAGVACAG